MSLALWAITLAAIGLVLLLAELALPTLGVLGILGGAALLAAIGICFAIEPWLGTVLLAIGVLASPLIGAWFIRRWPHTFIGRRLSLQSVREAVLPPPVQPGAVGVAISELRPIGICDFDGQRLEAVSDYGMIGAGSRVRVVNVENRRPTVRAI
jgi:membrane-bound serine protease (ClpP class)